jgi:hypothetical protein
MFPVGNCSADNPEMWRHLYSNLNDSPDRRLSAEFDIFAILAALEGSHPRPVKTHDPILDPATPFLVHLPLLMENAMGRL